MFDETRLEKFLQDNPDHVLSVTARNVDGEVQVTAVVTGDADGKTVEVAKIQEAVPLADVPCKLAKDFRAKLAEANKAKDKSKLPSSQRTAMSVGIKGVAEPRIKGSEIREALPVLVD